MRSALSATLPPIEGHPVGQHPLVTSLLQGVFNERPPMPRYNTTWEVGVVTLFIKDKMADSTSLTLKDLS